jgi:hypothetical protein
MTPEEEQVLENIPTFPADAEAADPDADQLKQ